MTLCDFAQTSQEGKLSIIGIFDRIFANNVPARHSRFFIVSILKGESSSKAKVNLNIKTPTGKFLLPTANLEITFGPNGKANFISDVSNIELPEIGEYQVVLLQDKTEVSSIPFFITKVNVETPVKEKVLN